jgi:hypothetical protein
MALACSVVNEKMIVRCYVFNSILRRFYAGNMAKSL